MRIQGVTGDLPAVAQLMSDPVVKAEPVAATAPAPAVAAAPATSDAGGDRSSTDRHHHQPRNLNSFDPPLIAQRAVLGFPLGPMVAEHAKAEGISYSAAMAEVQRVMPAEEQVA